MSANIYNIKPEREMEALLFDLTAVMNSVMNGVQSVWFQYFYMMSVFVLTEPNRRIKAGETICRAGGRNCRCCYE